MSSTPMGDDNLAIDHGKGAICYDPAGKSYIDFTSGIGVNSLGFADEGWGCGSHGTAE